MNATGTGQILVIDDDHHLLRAIEDFLVFRGYVVVTAPSAEHGLDALKTFSPDVIVLDIAMPGMGGLGFLKKITSPQGKPRHPVLVLTARAALKDFFDTVDVDGFLPKPCEAWQLESEIRRIKGRRVRRRNGAQARPRKVLLGDSDPEAAEDFMGTLKVEGYEVALVSTGPEVLEKAIAIQPDVVVLREILPGMNSSTVSAVLRTMPSTRDIPVVIYNATWMWEERQKYRHSPPAGAADYLHKPDGRSLVQSLEHILSTG